MDSPIDEVPKKMSKKKESDPLMATNINISSKGDDGDDGIYLTWKDLWVTVPDKKVGRRPILEGVSGYAQPGEVLAIMGPSGCGKSTLLDALAGRLASNTRQSGDILVNGRKQALAFGTSAYVTQDDTLMTTLTVKETVYYSAQLQLPQSMPLYEKKERAEETIKEMGLQEAMNTRIGGWSLKGLSGGQKRRVSICVEILTRPKLLFLDEPTSGLDSAASYHVMNRIIKIAQQDRRTIVASIHQPSCEVFELFDNLCLLSYGKTIYFGSSSKANEFFAVNGFPCPYRRNPSDHYLRTINKDFDDIEEGFGKNIISSGKAIDTLVMSYESSEACLNVTQRVLTISQKNGRLLENKGSQAGFITQCKVLTQRSFVNMYRDLGYYWLRFLIYLALCLCIGTVFHEIGSDYGSIQARSSMLVFVVGFLTFMAIGGFPSFVEEMKLFTRERLNGHYGVSAFVIGNTLSSTPFLLLISLVPGAVAYYLADVQKGIDRAGIQGIMMLNGGFFRLPKDLPMPIWKYPVYYLAFHKYAIQGFYKNEYETFTYFTNGGLLDIFQVELTYSKWGDIAIVLGMVILYRLIFLSIIKGKEKFRPVVRGFKYCYNI
ncbi:unnamed protein product [Withania somnifera]